MDIAAIIAAAGASSRYAAAGAVRHKLEEDLGGKTVLQRAVELFSKHDLVKHIVVAGPHDPEEFAAFKARHGDRLSLLGASVVRGGATHRYESVAAALAAIPDSATHIAVHDAAAAGITVTIEPLNTWDNGPCVFSTSRDTLAFIDSVGAPNLQLQYDVYHMQRMEGNIAATIAAHARRIGHIQVADSPGRNQPGTGELRFGYIFAAIAASGYTGVIGAEYNPLGASEASLAWLPPDRRGPIDPATIML